MKLLVGLGNPGKEYQNTPHNVGEQMLISFVNKYEGVFSRRIKFGAYYSELKVGNSKVCCIFPQEYMNLSGRAVQKFSHFYRVATEDILVLYDDVDLQSGIIRFKVDGSAAGHKGVISIIECLGATNFQRLRIGVGRPANAKFPIEKYVLAQFTQETKESLMDVHDTILDAVDDWVKKEIEHCMKKYNRKQSS